MRFIQTIKNIWTIEELRHRILVTVLLVLIYRLGCYVVLPGINPDHLLALERFSDSSGLMQLLNMFSGGAFSNASIFALGIMPYITASIVIQLLGMVLPSFKKMQREGESGRQKLTQYTRYLTVVILCVQGPAYLLNLQHQLNYAASQTGATINMGIWTIIYLTIILAAGSMFIMWLGERITDRGIGNGISFIILVGIIARLPHALSYEFIARMPGTTSGAGGLVMFIVELVLLFAVTCGAVLLVQGTRKVPVQYAKRLVGNRQYGGARQYIPLKVNAAGVMPIIFAQAIMFIPLTLSGFSANGSSGGFFATFSNVNGFWYNFVYFLLIVAFTYFYTAITVDPKSIAENLKKNNGFIPGIKPGKATVDYLDSVMSRITLPGSIFLGIVAILPSFARLFGVSANFAQFFGGTSLLILVGVVLDTLTQIESHLMNHHYDGLMKDGKIKGRTTGSAY
ncbi:MAG: preprotein translocase subunit SecY [Bacteroides sp.]|nr:preprotein translocase subunit SecY [Bacteroides sp.]MCM1378523.1 preprotein translocase subunit SecY [Bacteroides sp.]MCM1444824.1 preprotein translocase subunit SecY [Prevotella sp.]